jgi:hypothetical protein
MLSWHNHLQRVKRHAALVAPRGASQALPPVVCRHLARRRQRPGVVRPATPQTRQAENTRAPVDQSLHDALWPAGSRPKIQSEQEGGRTWARSLLAGFDTCHAAGGRGRASLLAEFHTCRRTASALTVLSLCLRALFSYSQWVLV